MHVIRPIALFDGAIGRAPHGMLPAQLDGMTRVCAWCNTVDGSGDLRPRPGDPVSHTMCPLCSVEHFVYTLLLRGRSYLRNLAHR